MAIFPVPSVFVRELKKQDRIVQIGATQEVKLRFYAISSERKIKNPAVMAICESAREKLVA
jgi:LysR family transcriptional activator of nhaA